MAIFFEYDQSVAIIIFYQVMQKLHTNLYYHQNLVLQAQRRVQHYHRDHLFQNEAAWMRILLNNVFHLPRTSPEYRSK